MSIQVSDLRAEVGAGAGDTTALTQKLSEAKVMVDQYVLDHLPPGGVPVPEVMLDAAYMAAAVDLWSRRQAPHGVINAQYDAGADASAVPIRISRDPLAAVRPILAQWCFEAGIA